MQREQMQAPKSVGQGQEIMKKKVQLKLAMPHAIKKVRDAPESVEALRQLIMA
jgi:hypothetical protein